MSVIITLTLQIECVVSLLDGFRSLKHQGVLIFLPWASQNSLDCFYL